MPDRDYDFEEPMSREDEIRNERWEPGHEEDEQKGEFTGYRNGQPTFRRRY